ncbi:hypothetical protein [Marinobacter sp.]|uniref:hypothetical protein n=1 Tax=Marinobacter sp. TaxID=50741 RepID=UPI003A8D04F4
MIWSDLYPLVLPHVAGCPEPILEDTLRRTAIRFCRDTHAWAEELASVYPAEGITRYQLTLPEGSELLSLAHAVQANNALWPRVNVFGLLHFDAAPNPDNGPIEIRAVLHPSRDSTGLPDRLGLGYDEALIHGTLATLQEMPGRDWTNPQLVAYHRAKYLESVAEARTRLSQGDTERPLTVRLPSFL